jgi:hypothetical protein
VLKLLVRREAGWVPAAGARDLAPIRAALSDDALKRAADGRDVDAEKVLELAEGVRRAAG